MSIKKYSKIFLGLVFLILGIVCVIFFDPRTFLEQIRNVGPWGPPIFAIAYILATVLFIPGSLLTLGAGIIFGTVKGFFLVSMAATTGAAASFLIGRYLARNWILKKIGQDKKFKALDEAIAEEEWKIVFLVRLSPVFPFTLVNYAFGLTKVSFGAYVLASWIGMLPGTFMYVYLGSAAGDIVSATSGGRARTPLEWSLYGLGLLATLAVTIYVTKIARKALQKKLPKS